MVPIANNEVLLPRFYDQWRQAFRINKTCRDPLCSLLPNIDRDMIGHSGFRSATQFRKLYRERSDPISFME